MVDYMTRLEGCRGMTTIEKRHQCERRVDEDIRNHLHDDGVAQLKAGEGKALVETLDKTGQTIHDIEEINTPEIGRNRALEVVTDDHTQDGFYIKEADRGIDIQITKEAANVADLVGEDTPSVLHQDMNPVFGRRYIAVSNETPRFLSDNPDIGPVERADSIIFETIVGDIDRLIDSNVIQGDEKIVEIDFEKDQQFIGDVRDTTTFVGEDVPISPVLNVTNRDHLQTVMGCGGWDEAINASQSEDTPQCVQEPVTGDLRDALQGRLEQIADWPLQLYAPNLYDDHTEERIQILSDIAYA